MVYWMCKLQGCQPDPDLLPDVADSLRLECEIIKPDDRLLDFKISNWRMYCTVLSASESATHNSGCLRLIVVGIQHKYKAEWETVIRLPLSAPDRQGFLFLVDVAMRASIAPTVEWLARLYDLTQDGHERALVALFDEFDPSMQ